MFIFYGCVDLDQGFEILNQEKDQRLLNGRIVSRCSGFELFKAVHTTNKSLKCWSCDIEGFCFVANKGRNDLKAQPVLDLFGLTADNKYVLMTRDHIIPKSYGGNDSVQNLRIGCSKCNHDRGNELDESDVIFMKAHPELITKFRKFFVPDGATSVQKTYDHSQPNVTLVKASNKIKRSAVKISKRSIQK